MLPHCPPSTIVIANHQQTRKINGRLLKQIADALFAELKISSPKLEINLVGAGEMTRLNEKFLKHPGATDVITFDYQNLEPGLRNPVFQVHGEIFICVDEAVLQARKFRTRWQSEIVRYLIHGVLHLLGYDDSRAGEGRKMKYAENCLLRRLSRRFSLVQLARAVKIPACTSR